MGQAFHKKNVMCDVNPQRGKYLTASVILRGDFTTYEVESEMVRMNTDRTAFVPWIPNNLMSAVSV